MNKECCHNHLTPLSIRDAIMCHDCGKEWLPKCDCDQILCNAKATSYDDGCPCECHREEKEECQECLRWETADHECKPRSCKCKDCKPDTPKQECEHHWLIAFNNKGPLCVTEECSLCKLQRKPKIEAMPCGQKAMEEAFNYWYKNVAFKSKSDYYTKEEIDEQFTKEICSHTKTLALMKKNAAEEREWRKEIIDLVECVFHTLQKKGNSTVPTVESQIKDLIHRFT